MATDVGHEFVARLDNIGIDTQLLLCADDTRWADLDTGDMGLQTEATKERIAAATVLTGRAQPAANRDSLATSLVGDREPVARLLPETRAAARANTANGPHAFADKPGTCPCSCQCWSGARTAHRALRVQARLAPWRAPVDGTESAVLAGSEPEASFAGAVGDTRESVAEIVAQHGAPLMLSSNRWMLEPST